MGTQAVGREQIKIIFQNITCLQVFRRLLELMRSNVRRTLTPTNIFKYLAKRRSVLFRTCERFRLYPPSHHYLQLIRTSARNRSTLAPLLDAYH